MSGFVGSMSVVWAGILGSISTVSVGGFLCGCAMGSKQNKTKNVLKIKLKNGDEIKQGHSFDMQMLQKSKKP